MRVAFISGTALSLVLLCGNVAARDQGTDSFQKAAINYISRYANPRPSTTDKNKTLFGKPPPMNRSTGKPEKVPPASDAGSSPSNPSTTPTAAPPPTPTPEGEPNVSTETKRPDEL